MQIAFVGHEEEQSKSTEAVVTSIDIGSFGKRHFFSECKVSRPPLTSTFTCAGVSCAGMSNDHGIKSCCLVAF